MLFTERVIGFALNMSDIFNCLETVFDIYILKYLNFFVDGK